MTQLALALLCHEREVSRADTGYQRNTGRQHGSSLDDSEGDSGSLSESHSQKRRELKPPRLESPSGEAWLPPESYLREPRLTFFRFDWRRLAFLRGGLLMRKVPLPTYSALYSLSFADCPVVSAANVCAPESP